VDWFYNNLQQRGDCQNTRKSHKTSSFVGWVVGWKFAFPYNQEDQPCTQIWPFLFWVDNFRFTRQPPRIEASAKITSNKRTSPDFFVGSWLLPSPNVCRSHRTYSLNGLGAMVGVAQEGCHAQRLIASRHRQMNRGASSHALSSPAV